MAEFPRTEEAKGYKWTASHIVQRLAEKHARDVAIAECPLEPWGSLRADFWAMRPSWAKPLVTLYEVKVTRQDFLRDEKWMKYLPYCNAMYFACAPGVMDRAECPPQAGLMEISKTGSMMRTLVKAPWRADDHEALARVTKSVLMNRVWTRGGLQINGPQESRAERVAAWRAAVEGAQDIGHMASRRIREELAMAEVRVTKAEKEAAARIAVYERFREELLRIGLDPDRSSTWGARRDLELALAGRIVPQLTKVIEAAQAIIDECQTGGK